MFVISITLSYSKDKNAQITVANAASIKQNACDCMSDSVASI